jgi:hypothetical protein
MTDQPAMDFASLVTTLLQQQTAMLQQQATLLQVHGESMRLQRLLVERLLGNAAAGDIAPSAPQTDSSPAASPTIFTSPPPPVQVPVLPTPQLAPTALAPTAESSSEPVSPALAPPARDAAEAAAEDMTRNGESASYAARYYRAPSTATFAPVQPQDLELLRRLREIRDSSGLILKFGPHKGETMGQVAVSDPNYIRQLIFRAQRPEVRAAACRIVEALDAAAEHKRRASRSSGRRSRASA